ncbi:MAG: hypothetical protein LQ337_004866 [Flavoplaca oasis]|nr:MAG: hypothetical protein LQ337_004866 [Flavoplaca oasis]
MDNFSMRTLGTPLTPSTSESSSDREVTPELSRRTSHFVRESVMNAIIYNQGRRRGSYELGMTLQQQHEDLDHKFGTDLEQAREEQRRTVDKMKMDHRTETTTISLNAKRHVDEARCVMLKYQAALKNECEQNVRKMTALTTMHEQERQQMKEEHDYKVDHLYNKISKLMAAQTANQDTVRQQYELGMKKKEDYINMLERKLEAAEYDIRESIKDRLWDNRLSARAGKTSATKANGSSTAEAINRQEGTPGMDQTSLVQHLRRTNAEQAKLIHGLQGSVSKLGRQLTEAKGQLHTYPSRPVPIVYPVSQPPIREAATTNFATTPMPCPQQYANGSNSQHGFPPTFAHTGANTTKGYHDGAQNPAPQASHELPWQNGGMGGANGIHSEDIATAESNNQ